MQRTINKTAISTQFAFCTKEIHSIDKIIRRYTLVYMHSDTIKICSSIQVKHTRNASAMKVISSTAASLRATDVSSTFTAQRTGL